MTMQEHMLSQPLWLVFWIMVMVGIHVVAVPLAFKDMRPRVMVIAMILNGIFMSALFSKFGYTRILGLSHVIFWTPVLAYLWKTRHAHPERIWIGRFLRVSMAVIFISLLVDYVDVIRYVLGDRAVVGG